MLWDCYTGCEWQYRDDIVSGFLKTPEGSKYDYEEVANELDAVLDFEYTEEEFESLCAFSVEVYLDAETMTTNAIAHCINDLVNEEGKTVEEILKMDKWDFIDEASNYLN